MKKSGNERPKRSLNKRVEEEQFLCDEDPEGIKERFVNKEKGVGLFATQQFSKGDFFLFYRRKKLSVAENERILQVLFRLISFLMVDFSGKATYDKIIAGKIRLSFFCRLSFF